MSEEEKKKRPQGRKRGAVTGSGKVNKRDEVAGTQGKPGGNADYSERPSIGGDRQEPQGSDRGLLGDALMGAAKQAMQQQAKQNAHGNSQQNMFSQGKRPSYTGGNSQQVPFGSSSGGSGRRGGGGKLLKIIILLVCIFLLVSCLMSTLSSGSSSGYTQPAATPVPTQQTAATPKPTPTPAPAATPAPTSPAATSLAGTFHAPQTQYVNTDSTNLNTAVASGIREKFTSLKGHGQDVATVLVYMCGTDLESKYGMGTNDLMEMVQANLADNVNVIVETGGTQTWQNQVISNRTNERYKIAPNALIPLDNNLGRKQMTDPNTLIDFVNFGVKNFPADRYMLIFWDHGGGSVSGYGYDQYYPNSTMTLDEISEALSRTNVKFDFIGFDACLMATAETAVAVSPYADYLIASEETEPGTGWYYTNWLNMLSRNTSTDTVSLGKQIIDDFIQVSYQANRTDKTSLSIVDLAEFDAYVPKALSTFAKEITSAINGSQYRAVAQARSVTKEFAQSNRIDQVDLVHFAKNINTTNSNALANAIQSCVKYNRCSNMNNAYGMSIYFPYKATKYVSSATQIYNKIGMNEDYTQAIRSFATVGTSGQIVNNHNGYSMYDLLGGGGSGSSYSGGAYSVEDIFSLLSGGTSSGTQNYGGGSYSGSSYGSGYSGSGYSTGGSGYTLYDLLGGASGVDTQSLELISQLLGRDHLDNGNLKYTDRDGNNVLVLDQEQWDLVTKIGLNVWVDDESGYIDLGVDNVFEFDDAGNLLCEYDGQWVSVNDQPVAFYMVNEENAEDSFRYEGYTLAELNGELVHILIEFTPENPDGIVLGAQKLYEEGVEAKGLEPINAGDVIDFVADYYDYNGNYQAQYRIGEQVTVDEGGLTVGTYQVEGQRMLYGYRLTDIYNANNWTPMLVYGE